MGPTVKKQMEEEQREREKNKHLISIDVVFDQKIGQIAHFSCSKIIVFVNSSIIIDTPETKRGGDTLLTVHYKYSSYCLVQKDGKVEVGQDHLLLMPICKKRYYLTHCESNDTLIEAIKNASNQRDVIFDRYKSCVINDIKKLY